jgi:tRNA-dependent cyclodipeptide synthase
MANVVTSSKPSHPSAGHARTYKTKISSVAPTEMREDWCRLGNGFLGVSLQNEEFVPPKLQAMTEWLHRKFARNAVLVGDSIHRITLETVRDMPKTQSLDTAMRLGDDTVATIQGLPRGTETAILRCSDIQMRSDYADAREQLVRLFDADEAFRNSVLEFSKRFQRRNATAGDRIENWKVRRSCEYFLEEFAVFVCLVSDGFEVMAYPGAFSTLTEIVCGDHEGVPSQLKELVVVSLALKGRSRGIQLQSA